MQRKELMNMDELEDVLYNETKEQIEKVLLNYKVSYVYEEMYRSFNVTSLLLNETCRGYKSHYVPKCVKYFGKSYCYNSGVEDEDKNV